MWFVCFQSPWNTFTFDLVDRAANDYFAVSLTGGLEVKTPVSGDQAKPSQYDVSYLLMLFFKCMHLRKTFYSEIDGPNKLYEGLTRVIQVR